MGITNEFGGMQMSKLDYLLGNYRFYRRIIGGTWYFIRINVGIDCVFIWSRSDLRCSDRYIVKREEY